VARSNGLFGPGFWVQNLLWLHPPLLTLCTICLKDSIEGPGVFSQGDIARVRGGSDAETISPEEFLFFFRGAVDEFFVGAVFDAEATVGIACQPLGFVVTLRDAGPFVVLFDLCVGMFDSERNHLTQSGDLALQSVDRASKQVGD